MLRLLVGLSLAALLIAEAPSIRLAEEGGRKVWIAEACPAGEGSAAEAFSVYVDSLSDAPPMAGAYRVRGDGVVFEPRYPPSPGVRYRAECRAGAGPPVTAVFDIPAPDPTPTTSVARVYPSSDELPENLLKFYLHFSAPMSRGLAYEHVRLLDGDGEAVELPFLEIDEELWDANYQRLTLLFDPGRIKSGLVPNQEFGMALQAGRSYTLEIDAGWLDAEGKPLTAPHRKTFRVTTADGEPLDPQTWRVAAPAGGVEPVIVDFPEPVDHALLERVVGVVTATGAPVAGESVISREETRWAFAPDEPWEPGRYRIEAATILEDLAGNSIGRPFEVDVFEKVEDRIVQKTASVPFTVGAQ